ncbi:MAG: precorrin-2 C(20)-methyltransferase [Atopobiaceae bacterium]|nr:precorrin-2 C(20)-methyltransferase [Atopobiaceae bacterium]
MPKGVLYGVSVGPGDPELMTLKAHRIIREADVIAIPSTGSGAETAYGIAEHLLCDKEILRCITPMTNDPETLRAARKQTADMLCSLLDEGRSVAYLCLGDIAIYSSYSYLHRIVLDRGYESCIVPGVSSISAAAARLGTPLCTGSERLTVATMGHDIDDVLDTEGTKVLMKLGKSMKALCESLRTHEQLDRARMVSRCGLPGERVYESLEDVEGPGYFSIVIVR